MIKDERKILMKRIRHIFGMGAAGMWCYRVQIYYLPIMLLGYIQKEILEAKYTILNTCLRLIHVFVFMPTLPSSNRNSYFYKHRESQIRYISWLVVSRICIIIDVYWLYLSLFAAFRWHQMAGEWKIYIPWLVLRTNIAIGVYWQRLRNEHDKIVILKRAIPIHILFDRLICIPPPVRILFVITVSVLRTLLSNVLAFVFKIALTLIKLKILKTVWHSSYDGRIIQLQNVISRYGMCFNKLPNIKRDELKNKIQLKPSWLFGGKIKRWDDLWLHRKFSHDVMRMEKDVTYLLLQTVRGYTKRKQGFNFLRYIKFYGSALMFASHLLGVLVHVIYLGCSWQRRLLFC